MYNTYRSLIENYTDIIKRFVNEGGSFKEEDKKELFKAIKAIVEYIYKGYKYIFLFSKSGVTPRDKKLIALYKNLYYIYLRKAKYREDEVDNDKNIELSVNKEIMDFVKEKIEFAVFCAVGIENYRNRNFLWSKNFQDKYNVIYFIKHRVAAILLEDFFLNKIAEMNDLDTFSLSRENVSKTVSEFTYNNAHTNKTIDNMSAEELIEASGYSWAIPEDLKIEIIMYLNGELSESEISITGRHFKKILKLIYKGLRENGII